MLVSHYLLTKCNKHFFRLKNIKKGTLLIRDLGYFIIDNFRTIENKLAYYLSRVHKGTLIFENEFDENPVNIECFFKKHTRHTFVSFLNEVRINESCKQLTDSAYDSISTIAYNCGFNSITNFNRVFKTVTTRSPSEYVNSFLKNVEHISKD